MDGVSVLPRVLSYSLLDEITKGFSNDMKVGSGSYGDVYKGHHTNGEMIAVKLLRNIPEVDDKTFEKEYHNLASLRHKNIVQLVGYCHEIWGEFIDYKGQKIFAHTIQRALCFEYMQNGSLDSCLADESSGHDWSTRYAIIKGICQGLKYLHEELVPPMWHLDLKPGNVLLDENMVPKIADFGLSRLFGGEQTWMTTTAIGTHGYVPPEYIDAAVITVKFDIFSLGVIIIKIMTGPNGYFRSAEMPPQQFIELVHGKWKNKLQTTEPIYALEPYCEQVKRCIEIALSCVDADRNKRPSIGVIIDKLNETEPALQSVGASMNKTGSKEDKSNVGLSFVNRLQQKNSAKPKEVEAPVPPLSKHDHSLDILEETPSTSSQVSDKQDSKTSVNMSFDELLKAFASRHEGSNMPENLASVLIHQVYAVAPSDLNVLLFSPSSDFLQSLADMQGTTGLDIQQWRLENDGEVLKRVVSYTKAATKLVEAVKAAEDVTYLKADGDMYAVLSEIRTPDGPSGNYYRVEVLTSIMPGPELPDGGRSSRLVISWRLNFLQSTMFKSIIENDARQQLKDNYFFLEIGLKDNFSQFSELLARCGMTCKLVVDVTSARVAHESACSVELHFDGQRHRTAIMGNCWNKRFYFDVWDPANLPMFDINAYVYHVGSSVKPSNTLLGKVRIDGASWGPFPDAIIMHCPLEKHSMFPHVKGDLTLKIYTIYEPSITTSNPSPPFDDDALLTNYPLEVPLQHLKEITNNFSDERILGHDGFGVLYKGVLQNGEMIAVKKIVSSLMPDMQKRFESEVYHLMMLKHPNIVRCVGYCYEIRNECLEYDGKYIFAETEERLICLEYLPKGSLDKYISDESSGLDWSTRYKIIKGICYGLLHLHEQNNKPIVHMNLKPTNILLDDGMVPKITDFGLSRLLDQQQTICTTSRDGTFGYMAPEFLHGGTITPKSDIFSLGVIIMEIVTGHRDYPDVTTTSSNDFIKLVLNNWRSLLQRSTGYGSLETYCNEIEICVHVGLICVNPDHTKRSPIRKVISMLEGL